VIVVDCRPDFFVLNFNHRKLTARTATIFDPAPDGRGDLQAVAAGLVRQLPDVTCRPEFD
jgi:hypothetical protein